ncbi:hypothetical protein, partial [Blastococcus sp. CCUG 61487]|uniref:hypothetical protein n=1 Tax=Blastococcus sp. CCUG 61487 TaxID=1840703 RepID=UPI001BAEB2D0
RAASELLIESEDFAPTGEWDFTGATVLGVGGEGGEGGVSDHGALTGLADDDHPQYLTQGRGDARYAQTTDPRLSDARPPTAHGHAVADLSDSTTVGRSVLTAADAAAARTAIGAGTSNLAIGTTSTTAKAGDYSPPADAAAGTASMRTLGTGATQAAAGNDSRITGAAAASGVEGVKTHDGTAGGGTRPTGFARVRWVGGTTRPTNMVTGDVWEHDA